MNNTKPKSVRKKRKVLGSRPYKGYSQEMLQLAVDMLKKNRMSSREAEKTFGIPRRTILNKVNNIHMKPVGGKIKLSEEEEEKLVNVLIAAADYGSPMTKMDIKILVFKYVEKNSRTDLFDGKLPSNTWLNGFLKRHRSKLSIRATQNITKVRAEKGITEMESFFENLSETLKNVPPANILNYDETNLSDNPGTSKCVFRRGVKHPERILNCTKSCISVMFTVSAAGKCLPTYVVYKSMNLYSEWIEGGPAGTRYNCSKSGWFDTATFEDYFKTIVVQWAKEIPGPKVVIGDNLSSHMSIEVVELCQKNNIRLVFLPPNSTHLTQPLDVAYFGPLKREWRKILLEYKFQNPTQTTMNKKHFPKLLAQLLKNMKHNESKNIISGFRATGIWPVNPRNVYKRIPEIFDDIEYGIDTTLLEYLKETRTSKPIQVKRSKKLYTEPGKSVSIDDILTKTNCQIRKKVSNKISNNKRRTDCNFIEKIIDLNQDKHVGEIIESDKENESLLDEFTGEVIINSEIIEQKTEEFEQIKYDMPTLLPHFLPVPYNPERLNILCVQFINMHFGLSTNNTNEQLSALCVINKKIKSDSQNQSFVAINQNYLPMCLQPKTFGTSHSKPIIISNVEVTAQELKNLKKNIKVGTKVITQSPLQMKINREKETKYQEFKSTEKYNNNASVSKEKNKRKYKKERNGRNKYCEKKLKRCVKSNKTVKTGEKKKKRLIKPKKCNWYSETSSENSDNVSFADSDQSEYKAFDEYISSCFEEIDDKENFEPYNSTVPFGLSDINFYSTNVDLKKDDWVVVKFTTKKSLKHFVGCILSIKNNTPTIKFTRKIKNSKYDKALFTYPAVEDICEVNRDDIEQVLPQPNISRRGQIIFDINLDPSYNIQ